MSHHEKSNYISLVTTLLVSIPYFAYIISRYQTETFSTLEELIFWASAFLLLIPVRIVAEIMMYIVASIITAIVTQKDVKDDSLTDERDKLIELKGIRNSSYAFMVGFLIAMVVMVSSQSPVAMFMVIIISGFLSEIIGIISQIYYYRKGF